MNSSASPCFVYLFEIDQGGRKLAAPTSRMGSTGERMVRIVAGNEPRARQRLSQMYPRWQVRALAVSPFECRPHG
jgi:hypothetical protein